MFEETTVNLVNAAKVVVESSTLFPHLFVILSDHSQSDVMFFVHKDFF